MLSEFHLRENITKKELRRADETDESRSKISRTTKALSSMEEIAPASPRFPDICMICKKKTLKVNHKAQPLTKTLTKTAKKTIKEAATLNNDTEYTEMLLQITGMDLIAREFQKHEKCYPEYTRHKKTEQLVATMMLYSLS